MQNQTRSLQLSGATNFRDLGGYAGQGGRTVRWRQLFRSDHLADLTTEDLLTIERLGVARVFDFRGKTERLAQACVIPGAVVHSLAIEPTVVQGLKILIDAGQLVTVDNAVGLMQQTYRDFVLDNSPRFANFLATCWPTMRRWCFTAPLAKIALVLLQLCCWRLWVYRVRSFCKTICSPMISTKCPQPILWACRKKS